MKLTSSFFKKAIYLIFMYCVLFFGCWFPNRKLKREVIFDEMGNKIYTIGGNEIPAWEYISGGISLFLFPLLMVLFLLYLQLRDKKKPDK